MRTVLIDLPCDCRGYVVQTDDEPCIVLNSRMSYEMNVRSYKHEMRHIKNNDFYCEDNISVIETKCHKNDL